MPMALDLVKESLASNPRDGLETSRTIEPSRPIEQRGVMTALSLRFWDQIEIGFDGLLYLVDQGVAQ